jgi:hypothetical protein
LGRPKRQSSSQRNHLRRRNPVVQRNLVQRKLKLAVHSDHNNRSSRSVHKRGRVRFRSSRRKSWQYQR